MNSICKIFGHGFLVEKGSDGLLHAKCPRCGEERK